MPIIYITTVFFAALLAYIPLPWLYRKFLGYRLKQKMARDNSICITVDDGPGTRLTPLILQVFSENNIKATFFMLGRNIKGREEIVRQIAGKGHVIASHGFGHLHAWKVWPWWIISDIKKGWQAIDQALGVDNGVYPFRPPNGKLNLVSLLYLWWKKAPVWFWTIDAGDTSQPDKRNLSAIIEKINNDRGGVIIIHDFDRCENSNTEQYVLDVLNKLIEETHRLGLSFSTLKHKAVQK